jgi:hypothetical protein
VRVLVAMVVVIAAAGGARGDPPRPPKRPVPAYDDRPAPRTTAVDVARAVARIVLFPARIVVDYGVRWPLGKLVTAAEDSRGVRSVIHTLFLGPAMPLPAVYPIAFYDFGFQSSLGLRALWDNGFLSPGSRLSVKLGTGGADWWRADGAITVAGPHRLRAGFDGGVRRRPDQLFFGLGPRSPHHARARYLHARYGVSAFVGWPQISATAASVATLTGESHFSGDASIGDRLAEGAIALPPPGYGELIVTERFGIRLALDTRGPRGDPQRQRDKSGARLDAIVEYVRDREIGSWLHLDAVAGGALRLDAHGEHELDLRVHLRLIDPRGDTRVPFTELAAIGGSRDLRGFASGRGRDLSAAALTLDYQWPLAAWLDATLYLGAGNVFGYGLSGLSAGKLRKSLGLGLAIAGLSADRQVELWSAVGTEPFDEGLDVTSFRLVLGYSHDY